MNATNLQIIGFREWIQIPSWKISPLRAKADTGAKTSAIDVESVRARPNGMVEFDLATHRTKRNRITTIEAEIVRRAVVKSSTGDEQERFFVNTDVVLGDSTHSIEISLVNRRGMIYRMLLGRAALAGHFLVDASAEYQLGKPVSPVREGANS